jgi:hypothetical protein
VVFGQQETKRHKCLATPGPEAGKENRGAKSRQNGTIKQIIRAARPGAATKTKLNEEARKPGSYSLKIFLASQLPGFLIKLLPSRHNSEY